MSGPGFAGMRFTAKSVSQNNFDAWVASVKQSAPVLTLADYDKLTKPSEDTPPAFYSSTEDALFNKIIKKFMAPDSAAHSNGEAPPAMPAMQM